ncbi:MAG: response regulator [Lachnospiraceae bacterium]|nr:response regulator [Lachnospiraceae bacterium]
MYNVFIADDELIIREGIKYIIDWFSLGFKIVGEAANGQDAYDYIVANNPDVVLMDVKMPKIIGTDVVKMVREKGYKGKIIILSGYTDFKYTQAAIKYGVDYYLSKPIDEDELMDTVKDIKQSLDKKTKESKAYYHTKTRELVIKDALLGKVDSEALSEYNITSEDNEYQVVIYEQYSHQNTSIKYKFSDLLNVNNDNNNAYDSVIIENNEVLLLKNKDVIKKFEHFLSHYNSEQMPQKNSPLDTLFIAYGEKIYDINECSKSYNQAMKLMQRRFFCKKSQHTLGYTELPGSINEQPYLNNPNLLNEYCDKFVTMLQTGRKNQINEQLDELSKILFYSSNDVARIKLLLTDLFISVKDKISHLYHNSDINFMSNSEIIEFINHQYYLYQIIGYFSDQFEMIINMIGNTSSDSVMDNIIHYIKHNYMNDIKLESLAPMFGYNSSYLGKIFNQKVGVGFNTFVDNVRIDKSKELLENSNLKVYEIAEQVGYHNVDYFHTKFKKYVHISPAEYRKQKRP